MKVSDVLDAIWSSHELSSLQKLEAGTGWYHVTLHCCYVIYERNLSAEFKNFQCSSEYSDHVKEARSMKNVGIVQQIWESRRADRKENVCFIILCVLWDFYLNIISKKFWFSSLCS